MTVSPVIRFDRFVLDCGDRRLSRDGVPLDVNPRYLDALILLAGRPGKLVTKDAFMAAVWHGVPVTDEALTQCIRTLRRLLDDDATAPRMIATVPKHGYRFVAATDRPADPVAHAIAFTQSILPTGVAGTLGGASAGLVGGIIYGAVIAPVEPGGALSLFAVMAVVTTLVALVGGAGVAFGVATAEHWTGRGSYWTVIGAAAGGLLVGAAVKLLGLDALSILLGRRPGNITGTFEGLVLGASVGLGCLLAGRSGVRVGTALAALCGALGGAAIVIAGGHLMAGSLDQLAQSVPGVAFRLDGLAAVFGERAFGPVSALVSAMLEGALFAAGVAGAIRWSRRAP